MNYSKFKSFFLGVSAVVAFTVFLTSCEKDSIVPEENNVEHMNKETLKIFIPADVAIQGEETISEFLNKATFEDIQKFQRDAIILDFLSSRDLTDLVFTENPNVKSPSNIKLDRYLTNVEVKDLNIRLSKVSKLQSRGLCFKLVEALVCVTYPTWCNWGPFPVICDWEEVCFDKLKLQLGWCP